MKSHVTLLLHAIERAEPGDLDAILTALSQRYSSLNPGWELSFLTLPANDPASRCLILNRVLEYENKRFHQQ